MLKMGILNSIREMFTKKTSKKKDIANPYWMSTDTIISEYHQQMDRMIQAQFNAIYQWIGYTNVWANALWGYNYKSLEPFDSKKFIEKYNIVKDAIKEESIKKPKTELEQLQEIRETLEKEFWKKE
jgi:hypothetical protein